MKLTTLSFTALAFVSVANAVVPLSSVSSNTKTSRVVPNAYIVELANVDNLQGSSKRGLLTPHAGFYNSLRSRRVEVRVKNEYNTPGILVGVHIVLSSSEDVAKIVDTPGVEAIRPVGIVPRPELMKRTIVKPEDKGLPDTFSTHVMTFTLKEISEKASKLECIDYNHPALGSGFGPDFKVIGGDAYTGENDPMPDNDPLDECAGHGTHVAGIIGANPGNPFNISGVAFEASLASYRVFGCEGSATDAVILDALIRAYNDGMDVLNLSLGGSDGWTTSTNSVVASRIAAKGRVLSIAAGNEGMYGSWYTSGPGNGINVLSVASVDNTIIPIQNATVHGVVHDPIPYLQALPFAVEGALPIYATSTDVTFPADACDPLPETTPDLSGYLVIIHRGTCTFTQKLDNAAKFGAKTFLIYNSDTGSFSGIGVANYTTALISADDGKFLVEQFVAQTLITVSFPKSGASFFLPDAHGGLVSSFSTYGPTNDMFFKPAFGAPGGNILSTLSVKLGSYAVESGTSMATPFVAGSAALLLKARGKSSANSVRNLLQTTAKEVASDATDGSLIQTASVQGAGLIQVDRAIHTTTIVSPGQLTLNDTANFAGVQRITVQNSGSKSVTYKLSHLAAGTAASIESNSPFAAIGPIPLTSETASVQLMPSVLKLVPGRTGVVSVRITPPKVTDPTTYPVYSGFINIASPTETVKVTYLGLAGSLKTKSILDNTERFFGPGAQLPLIVDSQGNVQTAPENYTLVNDDLPILVYRLAFGTPSFWIDLVDHNTTITPTLVSNVPVEGRGLSSFFNPFAHKGTGTFDKVKTIGTLQTLKYQSRNVEDSDPTNGGYSQFVFDGNFADNTVVPNGSYKILVRAVKVTGDTTNAKDYESWLSPVINVVRP